jgi:hypothetical protein
MVNLVGTAYGKRFLVTLFRSQESERLIPSLNKGYYSPSSCIDYLLHLRYELFRLTLNGPRL